jgi:bacterioferritin-associated ferredoxin
MFVCVCEQLNEERIRELIEEGYDTIEKLREVAGVAGRCQICIPEVERLLNEFV